MPLDKKKHTAPTFVKIAVTGSAGSGKSLVCRRLKAHGLTVINLDALAREAVMPGSAVLEKIFDAFGKEVALPDGCLNRPLLRRMITSDPDARQRLEALVHPEIIRLMTCRMTEAQTHGEPAVVVEVPLLFEFGLERFFDIVVVVSADHERMIRRLMQRDDVSREDADALLKLQMPDDEKSARATVAFKNDGTIDQLNRHVDGFYRKLIQK